MVSSSKDAFAPFPCSPPRPSTCSSSACMWSVSGCCWMSELPVNFPRQGDTYAERMGTLSRWKSKIPKIYGSSGQTEYVEALTETAAGTWTQHEPGRRRWVGRARTGACSCLATAASPLFQSNSKVQPKSWLQDDRQPCSECKLNARSSSDSYTAGSQQYLREKNALKTERFWFKMLIR